MKIFNYVNELLEIEEDGVAKIKDTTYKVFRDGSREIACSMTYPTPSEEPSTPEPSEQDLVQAEILLSLTKQQNQLNAIEAKLNQ